MKVETEEPQIRRQNAPEYTKKIVKGKTSVPIHWRLFPRSPGKERGKRRDMKEGEMEKGKGGGRKGRDKLCHPPDTVLDRYTAGYVHRSLCFPPS